MPPQPARSRAAADDLFRLNQGLAIQAAILLRDCQSLIPFDDLKQIALMTLWQVCLKWDPRSNTKFSTFAYTTIKNRLINAIRTTHRLPLAEREDDCPLASVHDRQALPERDPDSMGTIREWLAQLDQPIDRQVIIMSYGLDGCGYSLDQIAAGLGIKRRQVAIYLRRAMDKLAVIAGVKDAVVKDKPSPRRRHVVSQTGDLFADCE
ncbi:sigma-70 family RNA polymerase sigma factor [Tuwongella immobilis]|uniref:Rna polymerase sigma factor sigma-70 family:: Sigma70_r2: Sigma70_r4 n=1 Tax=Tuwongella immobilis TaxID=692036 RepID=A0A6C2YLS2_9BACT|nr:sigma-70 family RNA polymerase sigma factor [Tuwongella immobilis]VIP02179.1 rna polymerase sigma factor sigma-70 family : : Sigma70_r2: Sigma70_r4 [Tuwongella immobilis]VTS00624.1 rna polymerase sigma factor sigma-70 family : : Sigma70_r2: Sigma70_r4 [Tuwongella immobilis]